MNPRLSAVLTLVFCAGIATGAHAQNYPDRPIRLIVPFSPGGTSDLVARIMATKLGEDLGQTVIVDNRDGAGSTLGVSIAARATANGYTLLIAHNALAINQTLYSKLPYNALKDLDAIAKLGISPSVVVVNNKVPVSSMKDLMALAKKEPGKLNYGSAGVGSAGHLAVALLEHVGNVQFTQVPYKGGGPSVAATIAGEVQFSVPVMGSAATHVKAGRLKMLAVTSTKRSQAFPDVPTVQEAGVPGYVFEAWFGLFSPAGLPKPLLAKLNQSTLKALAMGDVREQFLRQGIEADPSTPAELTKVLHDDTAIWAKIIKSAGIPLN